MTKIALITGGSRGLGKSMVLHLAERGRDIILTYQDRKDDAECVVREVESKGRKAISLQLDVTKSEKFNEFISTVKTTLREKWHCHEFDILINNAGFATFDDFMSVAEDDFDILMKVHLKAPLFLSQKLLPNMKNGGRIVNISSGLTRFTSSGGYSAYAIMKGGVEVMTRYMAKELGHRDISVNTIAPGAIETDFGGGRVRDNEDINHFIATNTALGRTGLPEDIGAAVSMLLADECTWITGQRIEVSGGQFL